MQYDNFFKQEALNLFDETVGRRTAGQLGIPYYTLVSWQKLIRKYSDSYFSADILKAVLAIRNTSEYITKKEYRSPDTLVSPVFTSQKQRHNPRLQQP